MLERAFEGLGAERVVWHTDIRNVRSQAAIEPAGRHPRGGAAAPPDPPGRVVARHGAVLDARAPSGRTLGDAWSPASSHALTRGLTAEADGVGSRHEQLGSGAERRALPIRRSTRRRAGQPRGLRAARRHHDRHPHRDRAPLARQGLRGPGHAGGAGRRPHPRSARRGPLPVHRRLHLLPPRPTPTCWTATAAPADELPCCSCARSVRCDSRCHRRPASVLRSVAREDGSGQVGLLPARSERRVGPDGVVASLAVTREGSAASSRR